MNKTTYSGAYSRRRYSNLSTASGAFGTSGVNPGTHSTRFVLNAYAANPAMGTVVVIDESSAVSGQNPVADFAAGVYTIVLIEPNRDNRAIKLLVK